MPYIRISALLLGAVVGAAGLATAQTAAAETPAAAAASEFPGGQVSIPVGLTLIVKKITVSGDATILNVSLSFDGDTSWVRLNDTPGYLELGDGQRLFLRAVPDNADLQIHQGETLEGDLVFPGTIPAGTDSVTLVLNEDRDGSDTIAPGLTLVLPLKAAK